MGLLSGTKAADELRFLNGDREIATSNLWAVRVLVVFLFFGMLQSVAAGRTGAFLIGAMIGLTVIYWGGLHLLSDSNDTPEVGQTLSE